jgi:hypothetical protein
MSDKHWALKKEVSLANIIVTVIIICSGIAWAYDLGIDMALQKDQQKRNTTAIAENKKETSEYLKSIDEKMGTLIEQLSYFKGRIEGQKQIGQTNEG